MTKFLTLLLICSSALVAADAPQRKLLFFTKSSGYEHVVISWKDGAPSFAEKELLKLGAENNWKFEFSKDGSKFSPEYFAQFDALVFYTTGDLCDKGKDGNPPMSAAGKQAIFDYVKAGKGFVGVHSASDTFHTNNEADKGPDRYINHCEKADPYVHFLGGEFIIHGKQQEAKNIVIDPKFPGFEKVGESFTFNEEWYSLKDFKDDIHVLTVMDSPKMEGTMYERPAFPNCWARAEGKGRVFYTAMGHREDVWTNPIFRQILVGGIKFATGDAQADLTPNLKTAAPGAEQNPKYVPQPVKKVVPVPAATPVKN